MFPFTNQPEVGDEFIDTTDGSDIRVTSVDPWVLEVGFTKTNPGMISFTFEVVPEADFITAINTGVYKLVESNPTYKPGVGEDGVCWQHDWDTYVGFSWTYKFCKACNIKKDDLK